MSQPSQFMEARCIMFAQQNCLIIHFSEDNPITKSHMIVSGES